MQRLRFDERGARAASGPPLRYADAAAVSRLHFRVRSLLLALAGAVGCAGGADAPALATQAELITPRIRRLTNAEYDATVQALLGTKQALAAQFVPDARLYKYGKFDRNEAQIVEPMLARQLQQAAEILATEYVANQLDLVLPCAAQGEATCARSFFEGFLPKAYRRAVSASEFDALFSMVVTPAIPRDGFRAAVSLGIEAALQSTAFLYHSELGTSGAAPVVITLTNAEIASEIAYLLTGAPADSALAAASDLATAESREAQVRRLLQTPSARVQLRRMVKQWLDIDQINDIAKDKLKFPEFHPDVFDKESSDFVDEVVFARKGDFKLLMSADFTVGGPELAAFYGVPPPNADIGILDLTGVPRRGIMNRGAFLASYATPEFPSPVKRGARFLTQVLCVDPGDPDALMLRLALPTPNASKSTRQRFEAHGQGGCASCHGMIDSIGFTFGHFNAVGAWEAAEDGKPELPIDSSTTLQLPAEIPFGRQTVADSSQLAVLASESEAGRRCFARNLARFAGATFGAALEQGFIEEWQRLAAAGQDSVQELLVAYVKSRFFVERDPKGGGL